MKTPTVLQNGGALEPPQFGNREVPAAPGAAKKRVLVVDDNEDAAESLAEFAQDLGHEARTALDGASALTIVAEWSPDLIFLDIGLPDMDGYQVAQKLRSQQNSSQPFLIALTGYGQESDRRKAHAAGFDRHLVKPPSIEAVMDLLENFEVSGHPESGLR